jgi:hypothetical protein
MPPQSTEDRLAFLERRVEELSSSLSVVEERLSSTERLAPTSLPEEPERPTFAAVPSPPAGPPATAGEEPEEWALPGGFALLGRTLVALGGAYLLRALTAAGVLPDLAGVLLAFAYSLLWLWLADRAGAHGHAASAGFHGGTAILIGLPLLWETTAKFHYLTALPAAVALALFSAAVFTVAWRRRLASLAWLVGLGAVAAAFALIIGSRAWAPFTCDLVLLGLAGIWLAYGRGWHGLAWILALCSSGGVLLMILVARLAPEAAAIAPWTVVALALALCLSWLASFAIRLIGHRQEVSAFEGLLSVLAFLIGFGGAAFAARDPRAVFMVGALGCALSLACYSTAFWVVARAERRKLLLTSGLAIAFLFVASWLLLAPAALAPVWAFLAAAAAIGSLLLRRVTLALHGTLYTVAAAIASGLFAAAGSAFAAPPAAAWPPLTGAALLAFAAATLACVLPVPRPAPFWKPYASVTRVLQLVTFTLGAGAIVLYLSAPPLAGGPPLTDPGLLATLRTAVLVAAALVLGWAGRWPRFREAAWLVYPVLVLASLKLLIEDFPHGRPATLFVALALCGGAFIVAPRVMRRETEPEPAAEA